MKSQMIRWFGSIALLAIFALLFAQCEKAEGQAMDDGPAAAAISERGLAGGAADICSCLTANFGIQELSDAEEAALLFMREEEKLARDAYSALYEQWQAPAFANIGRSEQRHMDAMLCLINKYELDDPVGENGKGVFQNATLQEMYNTLTALGAQSLKDALAVGATIEDADISSLEEYLDDPAIDNEDIQAAFRELARGSRNHLRAFIRQLDRLGETYEPQYLSPEDFEYIISTKQEKGNAICGTCPGGGQGNGNGQGNGTGICDGSGPHGNGGQVNGQGGNGNCDGTGPHGNGNGNGQGNNNGNNGNGNNGGNGNGNNNGGGNGNGNGGNNGGNGNGRGI